MAADDFPWALVDGAVAAEAKFCCWVQDRLCPYHEGFAAGMRMGLETAISALGQTPPAGGA